MFKSKSWKDFKGAFSFKDTAFKALSRLSSRESSDGESLQTERVFRQRESSFLAQRCRGGSPCLYSGSETHKGKVNSSPRGYQSPTFWK